MRNKLMRSKLMQQELQGCRPVLTPRWSITLFMGLAVLFIPIGIAILHASSTIVEIVDRYDQQCIPEDQQGHAVSYIQSPDTNKTCTRVLKVPKKMKAPIFVYYQLHNFLQNHLRYANSRNNKQLYRAKYRNETHGCEPADRIDNKTKIVPCGLIAWSLFNDTYTLSIQGKPLVINRKGIAWKSDREAKFGSDVYPQKFQSKGLIGGGKLNESVPLNEQEDLMVWMRVAATPTFRKLYGMISSDLEANETIMVVIENNYNTYSFGGQKKLVLSTTSWIGGKQYVLGIAYLIVGGICLILAIALILQNVFRPRPLGDPSYLSWNRGKKQM